MQDMSHTRVPLSPRVTGLSGGCARSPVTLSPSVPADFFADLQQELAGRSRRRRREALSEHRARLEELEMLQERRALLLSPGREGATCTAAPVRAQPRPHAKPGTQLPPLPAPGGQHDRLQPRTKAPEEENRAKGARNRQLPPIPCASTVLRGWN